MYSDLKYNEVTAFYKLNNPNFFPVASKPSLILRLHVIRGVGKTRSPGFDCFFLLLLFFSLVCQRPFDYLQIPLSQYDKCMHAFFHPGLFLPVFLSMQLGSVECMHEQC